jgi:hypothetical protein
VFLVGPARSGTTLVFKALCLHPDTAYVSNWVRRFPAAPQLSAFNRVPRRLPALRRRFWFDDDSNAYVYGSHRSLLHRAVPMPAEGEPIFARAGFRADGGPEDEVDLARLRRDLDAVRRWDGAAVLVNKRIANVRRIRELLATFADARFLAVLRDGRAVANSLSRVDWWPDSPVWWQGITPRDWERAGGDPWELCARNWVEEVRALERGLRQVPPDQVMTVRYERFVAAPVPTLLEIAAFAGLRSSAAWQREVESLSYPNRDERWRSLPADVIDRIEAVQRPVLARYGYATSAPAPA